MRTDKILIEKDLYDISDRIKEIDDSYYILYNPKNRKFEVHSSLQKNNTLALILPFEKLDARTVEYVRKTRRERFAQILKEIEAANEKTEKNKWNNIIDKCKDETLETLKYKDKENILTELLKKKENKNEG